MKSLELFLISRAANVFGLQILACTLIFRAVNGGVGPYGLSQLGLVATLGSLVLALPTGLLVDRLKKKVAILLSHFILLILSVFLVLLDPHEFSQLVVVACLLAICRNFRSVSQFTLYGELLKAKVEKTRWINLSTLSWQVAAFLSPLLAGFLGAGKLSLMVSSVFFGASFLCQLSIVPNLPASKYSSEAPLAPVKNVDTLMNFFRGNFRLYSSLLLDFVVVLFAGVSSLIPFLHEGFSSPLNIGLLRSALPAGVILGTLIRLPHFSLDGWARKLAFATFGYGLCHLLLVQFQSLVLVYLLLCGAGFFDALSLSVRECILQLETPDALKGRVYALNNFLVNASDELSEWESGLAAKWFGVRAAIRFSGMVALLASAVFLASAKMEPQRREVFKC